MQTRETFLTTGLAPAMPSPFSPEDCSICFNPLTHPVRTPCNHTFDQHCLLQWLAAGSKHNTCPLCKRVFFALPHEELRSAAELRRQHVAQALRASNLISRAPPFRSFGCATWNISSLQRAAAQATHTLAQRSGLPGAGAWVQFDAPGVLERVVGPCVVDASTLAPAFVAMANLLLPLAEARGAAVSAAEQTAWRRVCEALWREIEAADGRKADAMILAAWLKEKVRHALVKAGKGEMGAEETALLDGEGGNGVLDTLLDYLTMRAWMAQREQAERAAAAARVKKSRQQARAEPKMKTNCSVM